MNFVIFKPFPNKLEASSPSKLVLYSFPFIFALTCSDMIDNDLQETKRSSSEIHKNIEDAPSDSRLSNPIPIYLLTYYFFYHFFWGEGNSFLGGGIFYRAKRGGGVRGERSRRGGGGEGEAMGGEGGRREGRGGGKGVGNRGGRGGRGRLTCGQYLTKVTIILPYPKNATDVVFSGRAGVKTPQP